MIYVVCCNDSLEYASLDKKKAEDKLKELNTRDSKYRTMWDTATLFWHIHEVEEITQ